MQIKYTKSESDITVVVYGPDGIDFCNHAGAVEGTVTRYSGKDQEWEQYAVLCNHCDAWCDRDGNWNE